MHPELSYTDNVLKNSWIRSFDTPPYSVKGPTTR